MTECLSTTSKPSSGTSETAARKPRRAFARLFLLFAALATLWVFATPLMAYPDEPSHTIRAAAVVRGQVAVSPDKAFGNGTHVQVPSYIANLEAQKCFAFFRDRTADCAPTIPSDDNANVIGVTTASSYNPMYYWIVGLPSLVMSGAPAIYAMRMVSAIGSALFYAAAFCALLRLRRPKWPLITASVAVTPMVLFLSSGINPNSIEIAATIASVCALTAVLDNSTRLKSQFPAIVTLGIGTAVLANTRSVSLVWLLCGLGVACVFFSWKTFKRLFANRFFLVTLGVTTIAVAVGLIWIYVSMHAPVSNATAPVGIANPAPNVAPYQAFVTMLDRTFDFLPEYIGVVGWLDSPVPQGVIAFWSLLFLGTFLLSLSARPMRLVWGVVAALLAVAIVPAVLQASLVRTVGFFWQGRYTMPLVLVAFVAAGMALRTQPFSQRQRNRTLARVLIVTAVVAHIVSYLYILRRYVVGITDISTWQTMISHPAWQPPFGWFALSVLYLGVLLVAAQGLFGYLFPGHALYRIPTRFQRQLLHR